MVMWSACAVVETIKEEREKKTLESAIMPPNIEARLKVFEDVGILYSDANFGDCVARFVKSMEIQEFCRICNAGALLVLHSN